MNPEIDQLVKQLDFCKDMLVRIQEGEEPVETPETCQRIYRETKENCKRLSARYRVPELAVHARHFEPIHIYFGTRKIKWVVVVPLMAMALLFESILLFFTEFLVGQIAVGILFLIIIFVAIVQRLNGEEERDLSETITRIDECRSILQNLES